MKCKISAKLLVQWIVVKEKSMRIANFTSKCD